MRVSVLLLSKNRLRPSIKFIATYSEDATLELRVKTVKYFKSIEKVQDEVEAKYGSVASVRLGLGRASAA